MDLLSASKPDLRSSSSSADANLRIELVKIYGRAELDLHGFDLETCPYDVYTLTELETLILRHNKLECSSEDLTISISPMLGQLKALTILDLGWNNLTVIPPPVFELPLLESLILNNNQLTTIDTRISNLGKTLKTLHLGVNLLTALPNEIGALTALKSLIAPNNQIAELPDSVSNLQRLEDIFLRSNALNVLPKVLCSLKKLDMISIEDNRIVSLPPTSELPKAQILHSVPQEVLPNIFIGSASTSKNRRSLALFQLTHHIVLTDPLGDHSPEYAVSDHFFQERLLLQINDVEAQPLDDSIRQCNAFLENAVQHGHKVLVNSTLGVSRSAAIICAYMIKNLGCSYDEALTRLRSIRGNVKPNPGFERQLRLYEKVLKAQ